MYEPIEHVDRIAAEDGHGIRREAQRSRPGTCLLCASHCLMISYKYDGLKMCVPGFGFPQKDLKRRPVKSEGSRQECGHLLSGHGSVRLEGAIWIACCYP